MMIRMDRERPSSRRDLIVDVRPPPRFRHVPGVAGWIFGAVVLVVLVGVVGLPCFGCFGMKARQTKVLAQAKTIGLALKLYARDHNGNYPRSGQPELFGARLADSNAAFAVLFPDYITSESVFANPSSAYQTRTPDNEIDRLYTGRPIKTLAPGENVFAYVTGLNDEDNPLTPLVADGTDGTGHYVTDPAKRGGAWRGEKAIVIRLDNSGALETLRGPAQARYVPTDPRAVPAASIRPAREAENLLQLYDFGPDVRLLDPAVDPPGRH